MKKRLMVALLCSAILTVSLGCIYNKHGVETSSEIGDIAENVTVEITKPFIVESDLDEDDKAYVELAKSLYLIGFEKDSTFTEKEKGAFFKWVISTTFYAEECESWWDQENQIYEIPYSHVNKIIKTHLNTNIFSPEEAFNKDEYDSNAQMLKLDMIGGYGGVAALEVLSISNYDNILTVELGSFNMEEFHLSPPKYILNNRYIVRYSVSNGNKKNFRILNAHNATCFTE